MRSRPKRWNRPNRPSLLRNEDYSEDANKCRALREVVLRSLVRQREMALIEAWRSRVAVEVFRARPPGWAKEITPRPPIAPNPGEGVAGSRWCRRRTACP